MTTPISKVYNTKFNELFIQNILICRDIIIKFWMYSSQMFNMLSFCYMAYTKSVMQFLPNCVQHICIYVVPPPSKKSIGWNLGIVVAKAIVLCLRQICDQSTAVVMCYWGGSALQSENVMVHHHVAK